MRTAAHVENMVTLAVCGAVVIGLYAMGAGAWSFWGLVVLLNLNTPRGGS